MSKSLQRVCITGAGSFLPGDPIPNDRIDDMLGRLSDAPERVQAFIETVGKRMLASSGVATRHFAVDPETKKLTHTVASLGEVAARRALEMAGRKANDVQLLILSSPSADTTTPPTSVWLQERLGIERCAEMEIHSNCSGVGKGLQVAYDALRLGRYQTALVVYSQISSVYLRSCYFNQASVTKTQAMLRYILADGSGAVFMEARPGGGEERAPGEVLGAYVESIGGTRPPGMTAGLGVLSASVGGNIFASVFGEGNHHLDQDFAAVHREAGPTLLGGIERMLSSLGLDPASVGHYVVSIPSMQLYSDNLPSFTDRLRSGKEKMPFRARDIGYCGGASVLIHFDEIARNGELKRGERVVLHAVESSKWMTAGAVIDW